MMRTKSKRQRSYKTNLDEAKESNRIGQSDEGKSCSLHTVGILILKDVHILELCGTALHRR